MCQQQWCCIEDVGGAGAPSSTRLGAGGLLSQDSPANMEQVRLWEEQEGKLSFTPSTEHAKKNNIFAEVRRVEGRPLSILSWVMNCG